MFDLLISHQTISHSNKHSKTNPPHWHFIKQDVFTWESESESAEQTLQASTMVSYKKTQKRKQTHHGKWVTKNAKGAMKRKGNIVDDAPNVEKKALPEGWCGKVVKIQLWVLVAVSVSLANLKIAIAGAYKQAPHLCWLWKKKTTNVYKKKYYFKNRFLMI